jgi:hypothetical protein
MRLRHLGPIVIVSATAMGAITPGAATVEKVPYPEIRAVLAEPYTPDAAFEAMRRTFADAVARRDAAAIFALVGPTFALTLRHQLSDQLNVRNDAVDNFKIVFGFRNMPVSRKRPVVIGSGNGNINIGINNGNINSGEPAVDVDLAPKKGPLWDRLAALAGETSFSRAGKSNLVCGPVGADPADPDLFEEASTTFITESEPAEWYFTLIPASVYRTPDSGDAPIARIGTLIVPLLGTYPSARGGRPAAASYLEILLPSGKAGWILASVARPLDTGRLCYGKMPDGSWRISAYDRTEY